jgi:protein SCO1
MSNKTYKTLVITSWALLVVAMVSMVASGMWGAGPEKPVIGHVPEFSLIDQDGKPVTDESLKGSVWVADFVFTRCAGPCPMMMDRMKQVQQAVAGTKVKLVTFTVDPDHDTPEVLRAYARQHNADPKQWTMLTGSPDAIRAVSRGMLLPLAMSNDTSKIDHSTRFLLVDADGNIRGPYSGEDDEGWRLLARDAARLAGRSPAK